MALILNIETATTVCSVSLFEDEKMLALRELNDGYKHAENLHPFILHVLQESNHKTGDLSAIAVSKGPGSYTGLRIGVSAAKGMAYALRIPLISVDTLQLMTQAALAVAGKEVSFFCPMIDARRMEVYTGVYDRQLKQVMETQALIVDEQTVSEFNKYGPICFFGDGMQKCHSILTTIKGSVFLENILPSAQHMGFLASKKFREKAFEDTAYFEPFYLKDFIAGKKKQKP